MNPGWYDAVYGDDPSTDNIFGREALAPRRNPLLHAYLRRGGLLSDFTRPQPTAALTTTLDRAIAPLLDLRPWPSPSKPRPRPPPMSAC